MDDHGLYYLTQDLEGVSHRELIRMAVDARIPYIQLRAKLLSKESIQSIATWAMENLDWSHSRLIINDHIDVAATSGAHGVHLGQNDSSVHEARKMLDEQSIIGGTANTAEEALLLIEQGVNYIGLGPYRFTSTKSNLSPVLGTAGVETVVNQVKLASTSVPVYVIGGIVLDDLDDIVQTGAHGVAVASAINRSDDIRKMMEAFQSKLVLSKNIQTHE